MTFDELLERHTHPNFIQYIIRKVIGCSLDSWLASSQGTTQINGFSHDKSQYKPKCKKVRLQEYPYNKCCYALEFIFEAAIYSWNFWKQTLTCRLLWHLPQMFRQFTLQTVHLRTGPGSG